MPMFIIHISENENSDVSPIATHKFSALPFELIHQLLPSWKLYK